MKTEKKIRCRFFVMCGNLASVQRYHTHLHKTLNVCDRCARTNEYLVPAPTKSRGKFTLALIDFIRGTKLAIAIAIALVAHSAIAGSNDAYSTYAGQGGLVTTVQVEQARQQAQAAVDFRNMSIADRWDQGDKGSLSSRWSDIGAGSIAARWSDSGPGSIAARWTGGLQSGQVLTFAK